MRARRSSNWRSAGLVFFLSLASTACGRTPPPPPPATDAVRDAATAPATPVFARADSETLAAAAYAVVEWPGRRVIESQRDDWLASNVLPGSIAKIAVLAEALEQHVIEPDTRIACGRRVVLADGRQAECSHPPSAEAFDVVEAIGQSCNFFAATVARRLSREQLSASLVRHGLPPVGPQDDAVTAALGLGGPGAPALRLFDALQRVAQDPDAIRAGLAVAADRGTAAVFARAGVSALAKTGTSRMRAGRSLGLTVALAPRSAPTHAVVVLLPGGHGADAAEVGATLLASFTNPRRTRLRLGRARDDGGYDVVRVDLEDYVAEVVAGETTSATPAAAREALAVAARTFALANRGRHAAEGFDVCSLTHCQVVRPPDVGAQRAAASTRERVVRANGRLVPVFYSAECGGTLDAATAVAGASASLQGLAWTQARPDPAGVDEPEWRTVVEAPALLAALHRAGLRGDALTDLRVETNAAGRVRRVVLAGLEPSDLGIDDFRRIVGRDLGWNIVRSTRFDVTRTARGFELRGRGHGHGVGLCVLGATRLAHAGRSTADILAAYFPGLELSAPVSDPPVVRARVPEAWAKEREAVVGRAQRALDALSRETGAPVPPAIDIVVHPTVESYQRATGREWWTAGATHVAAGRWTIDLIPLDVLMRDGRLDATLRHELAHVVMDPLLRDRPLWVREGLAIRYSSDERPPLVDGACPSDGELRRSQSRDAMASSYKRAAACVARALNAGVDWRDVGKTTPDAR